MTIEQNTIPTFDLLSDREVVLLTGNSQHKSFSKGQEIIRQNTGAGYVKYIKTGLVKVYWENSAGKRTIVKISKEGEFLGLASVFGNEQHRFTATALTDTQIIYTDLGTVRSIIEGNGKYGLALMKVMSMDGIRAFHQMLNLSYKQLPGRIAEILLYFSRDIFNSHQFELPLTRQELAELASTTKESFIRTLSDFKYDKVINLDGRRVTINSMDIIEILSRLG